MGSGGFGREVGWLDFLKDLCCGSGRVKELGGFKSADQFSCIKEIIRKEFQKQVAHSPLKIIDRLHL